LSNQVEKLIQNVRIDRSEKAELPPNFAVSIARRSPVYEHEVLTAGTFPSYWRFLRRWRSTLLVAAAIGIGAGFVLTIFQPPLYQSQATVEIQDLNDNFLNMKQVLPVNEAGTTDAFTDIQTQIKILQSKSIVDPVLARLTATRSSWTEDSRGAFALPRRLLALAPPPSSFAHQEAERLADNFKIRAVGQTRIIELTAESSNPRLAADFLNQLCQEYAEQNMKARWQSSQKTSESLARVLEDARAKLRESEDTLQSYATTSGLIFITDNKNIAEERLSQVQEELSRAEASRIAAQSRYELAKKNPPTDTLPDVLAQGSLREYEAKLTELRRQRAELAAVYTSDYGKVKRLDAQIASLERAIHAEEQHAVERIKKEYQQATRREKLLTSSFAHQSGAVSAADERAVQYNILQREVESNRRLYDEMLKQVKDASIAAAIRASNIRILDYAVPAERPSSPRPLLNCAAGLLVSCCCGILLGLVRQRGDSPLLEPGDGGHYLGAPELGVVLHDANGHGLLRSPKRKAVTIPTSKHSVLGLTELCISRPCRRVEPVDFPPRFDTRPESDSFRVLESCRAVVTSLMFSGDNGNAPRLLVMTSPGIREGKTTLVANLGFVLALIGRRVLLVDGDLRRPRLHTLFGLDNDRGLSTLLGMGRIADENIGAVVQQTSVSGLSLLSSGSSSLGSVNLLHSPELPKRIRSLKQHYDYVLVDTPPVLQVADARIFGKIADGVVLVVRAGRTSKEAAAAACERLDADQTRVLGLVLNDWSPKWSFHAYHADYARAYAKTIKDE
jgi:polysaccharide biosynthesis transport protein